MEKKAETYKGAIRWKSGGEQLTDTVLNGLVVPLCVTNWISKAIGRGGWRNSRHLRRTQLDKYSDISSRRATSRHGTWFPDLINTRSTSRSTRKDFDASGGGRLGRGPGTRWERAGTSRIGLHANLRDVRERCRGKWDGILSTERGNKWQALQGEKRSGVGEPGGQDEIGEVRRRCRRWRRSGTCQRVRRWSRPQRQSPISSGHFDIHECIAVRRRRYMEILQLILSGE